MECINIVISFLTVVSFRGFWISRIFLKRYYRNSHNSYSHTACGTDAQATKTYKYDCHILYIKLTQNSLHMFRNGSVVFHFETHVNVVSSVPLEITYSMFLMTFLIFLAVPKENNPTQLSNSRHLHETIMDLPPSQNTVAN